MNTEKRFYSILDYSKMNTEHSGAKSPQRTLLVTNDLKEAVAVFDALADKGPCHIELSEGRPSFEGKTVVWYGLQMFHLRGSNHPAFVKG